MESWDSNLERLWHVAPTELKTFENMVQDLISLSCEPSSVTKVSKMVYLNECEVWSGHSGRISGHKAWLGISASNLDAIHTCLFLWHTLDVHIGL